jgi:hypothetical protein
MSTVQLRVDEILTNNQLDAKTEAIEALILELGWKPVREYLMDLLRDDSKADQWREVMHVFWGAVCDKRPIVTDELIAWLYFRFDPHGDNEDNEVWSITSNLKGKSYLSKYDPLEDPGILAYLREIRGH